MKYYEIEGKYNLNGKIEVENSKNAILPIMAASTLIDEEIVIQDVPYFSDVFSAIDILSHLGKSVVFQNKNLIITGAINKNYIPQNLCEKLRASIFFLGAVISKMKEATIFLPGGCPLGDRPVDYHVMCLKRLNALTYQEDNKLFFNGSSMRCGVINLPFASVGATINSILSSVFLRGETLIVNAAKEPEIVDLINFLKRCGAKIYGEGSSILRVVGVKKLYGCSYKPIPDRIVGGTYLLMAAATGAKVEICNFKAIHNLPLLKKLLLSGCSYSKKCDTIYLKAPKLLNSVDDVVADVYPNFPTDLQPIMLSAALKFNKRTIITDNVFKNRFSYINQLKQMNAKIEVFGSSAVVEKSNLIGNSVFATDLRAGASLVLAGLTAKGLTKVYNTHFIERGYENIVQKLKNVGANICEKEE